MFIVYLFNAICKSCLRIFRISNRNKDQNEFKSKDKKICKLTSNRIVISLQTYSIVLICNFSATCSGDGRVNTVGSVSFKLLNVPEGTFPTGIYDDDGDQTVSAFWMCKSEVTYAL